ncbi:MAG TPA: ribosome biogenesis GTPase Der, partial [Caldisericia bacterium]|nr:ribosome biogenesis GTPase Der [Caldisericia bacterium]
TTNTDPIYEFQRRKIEEELKKSDKVIFIVDGVKGLVEQDLEILNFLRINDLLRKTVLAVNKADRRDFSINDFFEFGIDRIYPISAKEGRGVYELLEGIIEDANKEESALKEENLKEFPTVSIVGKPNVGKSTLFNKILNEERVLVSEKEFTTRDSIKEKVYYKGDEYTFIDTAGIRSSRLHEFGPIYLSMKRTENVILGSDIVLFMIDGSQQIVKEDQRIGRSILEKKKGCIILINKADLIKDKSKVINEVNLKLRFLYFAPILFISSKDGKGISEIYSTINKVYESYKTLFRTSVINKAIQNITLNKHTNIEGKIFYATQTKVAPPKFLLFVNNKSYFKEANLNFLRRNLIEELSLTGTPIELELRGRREK